MAEQVHTVRVKFDTNKAVSNARKLDTQMGRMDKKAGILGGTFAKLGALAGVIGFAKLGADMFSTITATEQMKASLETMTGSLENANAAFAALQEFATTTPFTVDQSVQAFVKMKSLGLDPTAAALTSFGNTASAMGKSMNQMIEAVADASTMEFERLKEFGIKARQEGDQVSFTFNNVTTTVQKNSKEIVGYLQDIGETKFAGAMEKQMARLPGKLSNLRDNVQKLWRALGDAGATTAFSRIVDIISAGVARITTLFETGFAQKSVMILLEAWVKPIQAAFERVELLWETTTDNMTKMWSKKIGFWIKRGLEFTDWMALLGIVWQAVVTTILEIGGVTFRNMGDAFGQMGKKFEIIWEGIKHAGEVVWDILRLGLAAMVDWIVEKLAGMLDAMARMVASMPFGEDMAAQLRTAAAGMNMAASATAGIKEEMVASTAAHEALVAALEAEKAAMLANNVARLKVAKGNVAAAWEEVLAEKALLDIRQEQALVLLEGMESGESAADILDRLGASGEAAAEGTALTVSQIKKLDDEAKALTKDLQPLLDKMKGVTEEERNLIDATWKVDEAMRLGLIHTSEEATELLKLLQEEMANTETSHDLMVKALERGIERLDDAFGDMWTDFLENGSASFSGLIDGFDAMLSEMIHAATTRPIMIELKKIGTGEAIDFDNLFGGVAGMVGTMGGAALGGGGTGAAIGSGIGSIVGGMTPLGPLGSILGGLAGGLIGGLFDSDRPALLEIGGTSRAGDSGSDDDSSITSAFGTTHFRARRMGEGAVSEIEDQIRAFDDAIAEWLDDDTIADITDSLSTWRLRIESESISSEEFLQARLEVILGSLDESILAFVEKGGSFAEQQERLFLAFQGQKIMEENMEVFGDRTLGEFLRVAEEAKVAGENLASAFGRLIEQMVIAYQATEILSDYAGTDLATAFSEFTEEQGRGTEELLRRSGDNVREMLAAFDQTSTGAANLASAVQERYALEIRLMQEIAALADTVAGRLLGLRDRIEETLNPSTSRDYFGELEGLQGELRGATSLDEIDRITAMMEQVGQQLFSSVAPGDQAATGAFLLAYLEDSNRIAQDTLAVIEASALEDSTSLRDDIGTLVLTIADPLELAANELKAAAGLQMDAANIIIGDDPTLTPGGPGGGREFGNFPLDSKAVPDLTTAVNTTNKTFGEGAALLAREGVAYRQATASQNAATRALAAAVRNIPGSIKVTVVNAKSEFS